MADGSFPPSGSCQLLPQRPPELRGQWTGLSQALPLTQLTSLSSSPHAHCFSGVIGCLSGPAAVRRPQSGLKGCPASQPDGIPTRLRELKCKKGLFFGITKVKAAHGISNASKHTGKEPFNEVSQMESWGSPKVAATGNV
ncbi:hypothetical protein CB1_001390003 [Camelus ferus]|nr:hypothetical protein CB1_001390003 [Camelus ferus]